MHRRHTTKPMLRSVIQGQSPSPGVHQRPSPGSRFLYYSRTRVGEAATLPPAQGRWAHTAALSTPGPTPGRRQAPRHRSPPRRPPCPARRRAPTGGTPHRCQLPQRGSPGRPHRQELQLPACPGPRKARRER